MKMKKVVAGICAASLVLCNMNGLTLFAAEPDQDTENRIFFDDRSEWISYTGQLEASAAWINAEMLNGTGRWTSPGGGDSSATMTFQGTGIEVVANQFYHHSGAVDVTVTVDSQEPVVLTLNSDPDGAGNTANSTYGQVVGSVINLEYGVHTAVINVPNKKFEFDGFYVLDSTGNYDQTDLKRDIEKINPENYTTKSYQKVINQAKEVCNNAEATLEECAIEKSNLETALVPYNSTAIPHSQMTASANSEMNPASGADGGASWAINDDMTNFWHSNYGTATSTNVDGAASESNPVYITLDLGGTYWINKYVYMSRENGGDKYNAVKDYTLSVAVMEDGTAPADSDFTVVKRGALNANGTPNPQTITLDEPAMATHVRLTATSSTAGNKFVTARNLDVYSVNPSDTTGLKEMLSTAKELQAANYTEASFAVLQTAINDTDTFLTGRFVQSEVDEQTAILQSAVDGLKGANANLSSLTYRIGDGSTIPVPEFSADVTEYQVELSEGTQGDITVSGSAADTQHASVADQTVTIENNEASAVLTVITDGEVTKDYTVNFTVAVAPVDKTALETLVNECKQNPPSADDYTGESYAAYTAALSAAENLLAAESVTQQELDEAKSALESAKSGLTLKSSNADLSSLTYQIGDGEAAAVPEFGADKLSYDVKLPALTTGTIILSGTAADSKASVAQGTAEITDGQAAASVTVTAENGTQKTYTVNFTVDTVKVERIAISGGDTVEKGGALTLTADVTPENATNKAVTWTSSNEMAATVADDGTVTGIGAGMTVITATAADGSGVSAEILITVTAKAAISASVDGNGTVQINGGEASTAVNAQIALGEKVTLTAAAAEGFKFQYWKQADRDKILSENSSFETYVGADIGYVAVFTEVASYTVTFRDRNGGIYQVKNVVSAAEPFELPEGPAYHSYNFHSWDHTAESILEEIAKGNNVDVRPIYTPIVESYNLTVNNGAGSGSYVPLGRAAVAADPAKAGKKFSHWVNEAKDIISYAPVYSFIITGDTVLTAVYVDEAVPVEEEVQIAITASEVLADVKKISFTAERYLPDGYTVVEHGVLLTSDGTLSEKDFIIGGSGVLKGTATTKGRLGTYTVCKAKVQSNATWYGRGYVTYKDKNGIIHTKYTPIDSQTATW